MLEIKVLTMKPTQLIFAVLQRRYSPWMFGSDNSQDQANAAVEGMSLLTQPGVLNWGLEELPDSAVSKLQLQLKRLD